MKVILLKDVPKVGKKFDIKDVSEGYALNMLLPRKLAELATKDAISKVEKIKANDLTQKKIQEELLLKNFEVIKNTKIELKGKANDKGHLFAGITKEKINEELYKATKLNLELDSIKLDKPIKELGEHKIKIEVLGKSAEFILNIIA